MNYSVTPATPVTSVFFLYSVTPATPVTSVAYVNRRTEVEKCQSSAAIP
jgi:hypothetical protein